MGDTTYDLYDPHSLSFDLKDDDFVYHQFLYLFDPTTASLVRSTPPPQHIRIFPTAYCNFIFQQKRI